MKINKLPTYCEIKIIPKHTSAKTQYYELDPEDEAYLYDYMIRFLADISEVATHHPEIQQEYFKRQPKAFPKGEKGPNSFASMLGGIISAKVWNSNHNISEPQLEPIEAIFDTLADFYKELPNAPQPIKFKKSLFVRE